MREQCRRRTMIGVVTSDKMQKTVVVEVTRRIKHATYKKYVQRRKRFKAHDETSECRTGDMVEIIESRPISRDKSWAVRRVLKRAE